MRGRACAQARGLSPSRSLGAGAGTNIYLDASAPYRDPRRRLGARGQTDATAQEGPEDTWDHPLIAHPMPAPSSQGQAYLPPSLSPPALVLRGTKRIY